MYNLNYPVKALSYLDNPNYSVYAPCILIYNLRVQNHTQETQIRLLHNQNSINYLRDSVLILGTAEVILH